MIKKKVSGQTIAIILLAVLLSLTVAFGGVYAYYSSTTNKVSGTIQMANLEIYMSKIVEEGGATSGSSEILISNGLHVPGQNIENSPLVITNKSTTSTYLAVLYKVNAYNSTTGELLQNYNDDQPLIRIKDNVLWYDYKYTAKDENLEVKKDANGKDIAFRCLITESPIPAKTNETGDEIVVIGKNCLGIPTTWGNEFQNMNISFTFQAYAIGSNMEEFQFGEDVSQDSKCEKIMQVIYKAFEYNITI